MLRFQLLWTIRLVVVLSCGSAISQEQDLHSANYFVPGCRYYLAGTDQELFLQGLCGGAIYGLREGLQNKNHCIPSEVTGEQLLRVVVKYVDGRPERLQEPFIKLTLEAMHNTWPCKG